MTVPSPRNARPGRRVWAAGGVALAVTLAMLTPMQAIAAGGTTFRSSFETTDAAPVLTGTGAAVNVTGDRFTPGSVLGQVSAVTASAQNTPNEGAANVADGNAGTKWLAFQNTGWVQYQLSTPQPMVRYTLTSGGDAQERDPKDFRVQGSNNGTDWDTVDQRSGELFTGRGETRSFTLATPSPAYTYYRLDVQAVRDPSKNILQLAGWEPIAVDGATPPPSDLFLATGSGPASSDTAKTGVGFTGVKALQYTGRTLAAGPASSTSTLYSDVDIAVADDTALSYAVFPVLDGEQTYAATFVAVDLRFTDGTTLSTSGAVDSYGYAANAKAKGQSNSLWPNQWNRVTVDLGQFAGRTVDDVLFTYDHPGSDVHAVEVPTAGTAFTGWLDDISIAEVAPRDISDGLVSFVDTRRGTNSTGGFSRGNNFPAVAWPNGFNFITPMTNADNAGTLYQYQRANNAQNQPTLNGIGISHEPSIWMGDRNSLAVMPAANGNPTSSLNDRKLTFSHDNEIARPDIYSVGFDNGIQTDVTATDHGAIYRFEFTGDASSVVIDQLVNSSKLSVTGDTVTGWVDGGSGWPGRTRMFVYGTFDRQPTASGATTKGDRNGTARYAAFDTSGDRTVELRLSTSFISQDQARKNFDFELSGVSFDKAHAAVEAAWNDRLGVVHDVKGATDAQLVNLYSSLYRLNLYPNSQFENTGSAADPVYKYASPVSPTTGSATDTQTNAKIVDGKIYVNNGFWDTYRTAWPLYSLLYPDVTEDLVDGFVQQYRDGGWVARWSSPGYADLMTGTSSDVAFAEAYLAGSLDTDTALEAYDAAVKNATVLPPSNDVGRKGIAQSIFLGYTEATTHESASWGLEGFINDFGIAEMAKALSEDPKTPADRIERLKDEATYFEARAEHYVEMFNPEAGTFTSRNADGSWTSGADFDKKAWGGAFTEASAWTFGYHAPHDVDGLAVLYGGRQGLLDNLHQFLTTREKADYSGIHEAREARDVRLGMLGMSNQISHHIPYVLAEAGDPSGAQKLIRDIQDRLFVGSDIGQGYPGDEDNGEFSAWYVFSALGFYPMEVGSGNYTVGTPLFDSATLSIGDTDLVINAPGASSGKDYVAGVSINGTAVSDTTFDGDLVRAGGTLDFTMSAQPSAWGAKDLTEPLAVPTSLVDATKPGRGILTAADGTPVGALVDDNMNSKTTFAGTTAELVWTSQSGPVSIGQYTLTDAAKGSAPSSWTLSGSTDGVNWTELDSRTGETFAWDTQTRPFTANGEGGYTSIRLSLTGAGDALSLSEVELFAKAAGADGLSITPAAPQRVAAGTSFTGSLGTIIGEETDAAGYTVTVDYGDGTPVPSVKLTRDDLGGWKVSAPHTFDAPGTYTATIVVRDSTGATASGAATVTVYRDETLVGSFNGVCIGDLNLTAANCDDQGYGYYRDKLAADGFVQGQTLTLPGSSLTYDLPAVAPGAPDNITGEGQTIRLDLGTGATQLAFVGTATEKARQPEAVLHFTDGSEQRVQISFGDWVGASGSPAFGNSVIAVSEGRLSGTGAESSVKNTAIYATAPITIDLDADGKPKVVESLTMPKEAGTLRDGRVHVFAIASDGDRAAAAPLAVTASTVADQIAGEEFEAALATISGGSGETTAVVNWGDGSPVSTVDVASGAVTGTHTYAAAGTYTVTVTADDGVKSADAQLQIVVAEPEPEYEPVITVDGAEVEPGDTVHVTGTGFAPGESVSIRIDDEEPVVVKALDDGTVSADVTVPADAVDGAHPVIALGSVSNVEARATVLVVTGSTGAKATTVALSTTATDPVAGESVALTATLKPAGAAGQVEFLEGDVVVGSAGVSAGTATADIRIETSGAHTYVARFVPSDPKAYLGSTSAPLTLDVRSTPVLDAEIVVGVKSVVQGGSFELIGRGFGAGEKVSIVLHSDPIHLADVVADGAGSFRIQVAVPANAPVGAHTVVATGADTGLTAQAALQVTAAAAVGGGLAGTGGAVPIVLIVALLVLLAAGGVLVTRRRRES
ncbi:GH92 family glycosyl hydrolase [Microbacterium sp. OVT16B]|uniref:GH92 family glycosyl hydrolase n=1 Tax=Microbacterium sp. OVT16B TaxID=2862682 RepID=UPI001CC04875|nr:GH92 family glycosyl hydrolase [Microbacterium sp. OVT16B]